MAYTSRFFNSTLPVTEDPGYAASEFSSTFNIVFTSGVFANLNEAALSVSAVGNTMNIAIAVGDAAIRGYFFDVTSAEIMPLDAATSQVRTDRVIMRLDLGYDATGNMRVGSIYPAILKGTPGGSAVALTRNNEVYEMCLAEIIVPANAIALNNATITDTRGDVDLCGFAAFTGQPAYQPPTDVPANVWDYTVFPETMTEEQRAIVENTPSLYAMYKASAINKTNDALASLNPRVGDTQTTMRTDLDARWALCNGDVIFNNEGQYDEYSELSSVPRGPSSTWNSMLASSIGLTSAYYTFSGGGFVVLSDSTNKKIAYRSVSDGIKGSWTVRDMSAYGGVTQIVQGAGGYWIWKVSQANNVRKIYYSTSLDGALIDITSNINSGSIYDIGQIEYINDRWVIVIYPTSGSTSCYICFLITSAAPSGVWTRHSTTFTNPWVAYIKGYWVVRANDATIFFRYSSTLTASNSWTTYTYSAAGLASASYDAARILYDPYRDVIVSDVSVSSSWGLAYCRGDLLGRYTSYQPFSGSSNSSIAFTQDYVLALSSDSRRGVYYATDYGATFTAPAARFGQIPGTSYINVYGQIAITNPDEYSYALVLAADADNSGIRYLCFCSPYELQTPTISIGANTYIKTREAL